MRRELGRLHRRIDGYLIARMRRQPYRLLATLATLFDMRREAEATAWGRAMVFNGDDRAAVTSLRRNIHRLEKGMIMRPRRVPFGRDYLAETVGAFNRLSDRGVLPEDDTAWAADVLDEYFRLTAGADEPWHCSARAAFRGAPDGQQTSGRVPFERGSSPEQTVTVEALEGLALRRRSVRWFASTPVDPDKVDRALAIAGQAPSACNRQNVRLHLVYGSEQSKQILDTVGGTRGFSHQVPCVAVLVGSMAGYRHSFDRHAVYIDGGLLAMGFLFALETQGISSCCVNWPDVKKQNDDIRKLVPLERDEQVLMLIALGHADGEGLVPFSQKRSLDQLRRAD